MPGEVTPSVLVLTHRKALGRDQATRFGCKFYADFQGSVETVDSITGEHCQINHLVCCVNSLTRLPHYATYTYVIIDEVGLVRRHLVSEITHSVLGTVMLRLKGILERAECMIMSQASISMNDILFFSRYKNVYPSDRMSVKAFKFDKPVKYHPVKWTSHFLSAFHKLIEHYRNTLSLLKQNRNVGDHAHHFLGVSPFLESNGESPNTNTSENEDYNYNVTADDDDMNDDTITQNTNTFEKGCKVPFVVYSTSKHMADCMSWVLAKVAEEEGADASRIKLLTGDTRMNEGWEADFLRDPNAYSWQADVVIATNIIGAGFSIDSTFYGFFAFFFNEILSHDEEAQMSVRLRFQIENMPDDDRRQSYMFIESGRGESYHLDRLREDMSDMNNVEAKFWKDHRMLRTTAHRQENDQNANDYNSLSSKDRASITNTKLQDMSERRRTFVRHCKLWEDRMKIVQMRHVQLDENEYSDSDLKESKNIFNQWTKTRKITILDQLERRHRFFDESPFCPLETIRAIERGQHVQIAEFSESERTVSHTIMKKQGITVAQQIMKQTEAEFENASMANIIFKMKKDAAVQKSKDLIIPTSANRLAKQCTNLRRFIRWCAWCYQSNFVQEDIEAVSSLWDHLHTSKRSFQYTATLMLADLILFEVLCRLIIDCGDGGETIEFLKARGSWPFFTGVEILGSKDTDRNLVSFYHKTFILNEEDDHNDGEKKDIYRLCLSFFHDTHNNTASDIIGITTKPDKALQFTKKLIERATGLKVKFKSRHSQNHTRRNIYTTHLCPYDIALALLQKKPFCGLLKNTLPCLFAQNGLREDDKQVFRNAIEIYNKAIADTIAERPNVIVPERLCIRSIERIAAERISMITPRQQEENDQLFAENGHNYNEIEHQFSYTEAERIAVIEAQSRVQRNVEMQDVQQWRREVQHLRRQPHEQRRTGRLMVNPTQKRRKTNRRCNHSVRNIFVLDQAQVDDDEDEHDDEDDEYEDDDNDVDDVQDDDEDDDDDEYEASGADKDNDEDDNDDEEEDQEEEYRDEDDDDNKDDENGEESDNRRDNPIHRRGNDRGNLFISEFLTRDEECDPFLR